jgi:hypothetical protein
VLGPVSTTVASVAALKAMFGGHAAVATYTTAAHYATSQYGAIQAASSHLAATQCVVSQAGAQPAAAMLCPTPQASVVGFTLRHLDLQIAKLLGKGVDRRVMSKQEVRRKLEPAQYIAEWQQKALKKRTYFRDSLLLFEETLELWQGWAEIGSLIHISGVYFMAFAHRGAWMALGRSFKSSLLRR